MENKNENKGRYIDLDSVITPNMHFLKEMQQQKYLSFVAQDCRTVSANQGSSAPDHWQFNLLRIAEKKILPSAKK